MSKTALVTGAARRIGAEISRTLHREGFNLVLHYRESESAAADLRDELNSKRSDSVRIIRADLLEIENINGMVAEVLDCWGGIDVLVNNASAFYPTEVATVSESDWDEIIGCNLKAPYFLSLALASQLGVKRGCIVNLVDIHAQKPHKTYSVYCISKAGLVMLTQSLARELAPDVRVNGIAPGAIMWPENDISEAEKKDIVSRIALGRTGTPSDVAKAVLYLVESGDYITGQIIPVDGGRSLYS